jgi:hypothetical protein
MVILTSFYTHLYEGRLQSSWTHLNSSELELWRCGDGLFFEVPPLASDALLTTLHLLTENVLQTVDRFQIYCLGAPFSWLEKPRNRMGRDLYCMANVLMGFHQSTFSKPRQEISESSTVCSTFSRSAWSVVRSASLVKGGTSKKRPSPHLHKVPARSNKVGPRTLQTTLINHFASNKWLADHIFYFMYIYMYMYIFTLYQYLI